MDDHVALITGITGQDGAYLAEFLLSKGYRVHGTHRRSSTFKPLGENSVQTGQRWDDTGVHLHVGDLLDPIGLRRVISDVRPTEVYNLAAQSQVHASFHDPIYTAQVVAMGTLNLLESLRDYRDATSRDVRFYQASSSELFGKAEEEPQSERTPFRPRNPYACAKAHAYWQTVTYREGYGLYACNGILFNHESPRRGEQYVTRKITRAATRIKLGLQDELRLGNLDAKRDWGFAGDYVKAMWLMLRQTEPDDYVIATGKAQTVQALLDAAFGLLDLDWRDYVRVDRNFLRPTEPTLLRGDASKAKRVLGWAPEVTFDGLVRMMVEADMELAQKERTLVDAGFSL